MHEEMFGRQWKEIVQLGTSQAASFFRIKGEHCWFDSR